MNPGLKSEYKIAKSKQLICYTIPEKSYINHTFVGRMPFNEDSISYLSVE